MRRAAKRDASEPAIIAALRAIGALVQPLNGRDIPDLLIGYRGRIGLIEAKSRGGKLEPGQQEFHQQWAAMPVGVAYNADDAIALVRGWWG